MLIRFSIENFLSFGSKTEFSAIATRELHHGGRIYRDENISGLRLVPIAAIYGPNASGKSNLFKALVFIRDMVTEGTRSGENILVSPFRLNPERASQPSKFEVEFLAAGKAYLYKASFTESQVVRESLIEKRAASEAMVFERNIGTGGSKYDFGPGIGDDDKKTRLFLEFVGKGARANQLFLHEALDRGVHQLSNVVKWFRTTLTLIAPEAVHQSLGLQMHLHGDLKNFCSGAIQRIGAGIESLGTEVIDLETAGFPAEVKEHVRSRLKTGNGMTLGMPDGQRYYIIKTDGTAKVMKMVSYHLASDGKKVRFEIPEESDGTQRVLDLLPALHMLGQQGESVVFVDELDRSLHSALTHALIESYLDARKPEARTQLFFTTHDATLMDKDLFRRDEIWLVEKDETGESRLASISDYQVRSDKRLMKDYFLGRYGGIPRIRPMALGRKAQRSVKLQD